MFANITLVKIRRANYWPLSSLPYSLIFLKIVLCQEQKMQQILMFPSINMWIAFNQMPGVLMSLAKSFRSPIPFLFTPPWIEYEKQRIFAYSVLLLLLPQNCKQISKLNENSKWRCKYSAKIIGVWHKNVIWNDCC